MDDDLPIPSFWKRNARPALLQRRFEFCAYAQTREFLERLAQESERSGCYPDLSFGPRYVSVSLHLDGDTQARAVAYAFAEASNRHGTALSEATHPSQPATAALQA